MAVIATDNFNRADETPLASPWVHYNVNALWNLATNFVGPGFLGNDTDAYYDAIFPDDQYSQARLTITGTAGGTQGVGLLVRGAVFGTRTYYRFIVDHAASDNVSLVRFNEGASDTLLLQATQAFTDGDLFRVAVTTLDANTVRIKAYLNGVQFMTFDDTDALRILSGRPGIAYSSAVSAAQLDDWEGGSVVAPAAAPVFVVDSTAAESFFSDSGFTSLHITGPVTNGIVLLECSYDGGTPQIPTINGSAADVVLLKSQVAPSGTTGVNVYYKLAPIPSSSCTIAFQSTGASIITIYGRVYRDVDQTVPFGVPVSQGFTSVSTLTLNVPSDIGELVLDMAQWRSAGPRTATVGAGQTAQVNSAGFNDGRGSSEEIASANLFTTMSWTLSPSATPVGVQIGVVLNGAQASNSAVLSAAGVGVASFVGNYRVGAVLAAAGIGALNFVGTDGQPIPQRFFMSKGNTFETDILGLIFNATTIANIAVNATSSPLTNLFVALHTADPGEAGDQTTNETAYTGYARATVARTSGAWSVASGSVSPIANIDFPVCTASPGTTLTHASVGVAVSGASKLLYSGALSPQIAIAIGVIPRITTASTITED